VTGRAIEEGVPSDLVTAIDVGPDGQRWMYVRGQGRLTNLDRKRRLVDDLTPPPFELFHDTTPAGLSCASCHPEGQDDGHVWNFVGLGERRTQNLAGGLSERAPFHWDSEFDTLDSLMSDVFAVRMGAGFVYPHESDALAGWLDGIRPLRSRPPETGLVGLGRTVFEREDVGCLTCHQGRQLADAAMHEVRPGDPAFKTPSLLGVGARAPYMHDGCAETLEARFTDPDCGGGDQHGQTSQLSPQELDALVAYLRTL
ncbi:MAG: c-type cytochrome, partial [Myxococcota bacterium]